MEKRRFVIDMDRLDEGEDARVYWDDQNIVGDYIDDFTKDDAEEEPEDPELEKWVDAIVSVFPYSKTECYTRLNAYYAIRKSIWNTDARELVTSIKKEIKFLPNPKKDAASFLRNEFGRIKYLFEECPQCEVVLEYSREILVNSVLSDTWDDNWWDLESLKKESAHEYPAKDEILIWDEFWEKAEPILDSYLKPLGYLATLKWLQLCISQIESPKQLKENNTLTTKQENVLPSIIVSPEKVDHVLRDLFPYIMDEESKANFSKLLTAKAPSDQIKVTCQQNSLGHFFRQIHDAGHIREDKKHIEYWLCYWFIRWDKGRLHQLSPSAVHDALGPNKSPAKGKRIPYSG